jgi:hypothetical protein
MLTYDHQEGCRVSPAESALDDDAISIAPALTGVADAFHQQYGDVAAVSTLATDDPR